MQSAARRNPFFLSRKEDGLRARATINIIFPISLVLHESIKKFFCSDYEMKKQFENFSNGFLGFLWWAAGDIVAAQKGAQMKFPLIFKGGKGKYFCFSNGCPLFNIPFLSHYEPHRFLITGAPFGMSSQLASSSILVSVSFDFNILMS